MYICQLQKQNLLKSMHNSNCLKSNIKQIQWISLQQCWLMKLQPDNFATYEYIYNNGKHTKSLLDCSSIIAPESNKACAYH